MAGSNVTTKFKYNDRHNHFPIAAAVALLGEIAMECDKDGLRQASRYIDNAPTILLRGISFLSECLEANEEAPPFQAALARRAIQEVTALCAALMEVDCDAEFYRVTKFKQEVAA